MLAFFTGSNMGLWMGIITLIFGIIVMIFPRILNYIVGIYLIIIGVMAIVAYVAWRWIRKSKKVVLVSAARGSVTVGPVFAEWATWFGCGYEANM
jgi:uncharacterized membrane protein HdeD (DUF308 family)